MAINMSTLQLYTLYSIFNLFCSCGKDSIADCICLIVHFARASLLFPVFFACNTSMQHINHSIHANVFLFHYSRR